MCSKSPHTAIRLHSPEVRWGICETQSRKVSGRAGGFSGHQSASTSTSAAPECCLTFGKRFSGGRTTCHRRRSAHAKWVTTLKRCSCWCNSAVLLVATVRLRDGQQSCTIVAGSAGLGAHQLTEGMRPCEVLRGPVIHECSAEPETGALGSHIVICCSPPPPSPPICSPPVLLHTPDGQMSSRHQVMSLRTIHLLDSASEHARPCPCFLLQAMSLFSRYRLASPEDFNMA